MLSRGLACFLEGWKAFDMDGIHLYSVEMLSSRLACILEVWNAF
jgi:hypothetical protein